ncbi:type II toxin-antitoxin system RelE/ParE family toxin [Aquibium sp. LZ166]|uniref:Type II toxin-antitoxin system RelE/ParE family toxin n=1 Tax=Aquibium pacificus TaxID=3153579 RepID=A0ABV3SRL5_9HYPH
MIRSVRDKRIEAIIASRAPKGFPSDLVASTRRKLFMLDNAKALEDLLTPPGNRLEALKGDRKGQYSIRINDQFRICFRWLAGNVEDVEIVDYH